MKALLWIHIASGLVALGAGAVAVAVRKGGARHGAAGRWFFVSMLVLGLTASLLSPFKNPPDSPLGGIVVCYFVGTAWAAARRREDAGWFEKTACAVGLVLAFALLSAAFQEMAAPGTYPAMKAKAAIFLGGVCLLAGLGDLRLLFRRSLPEGQRVARHLWRMCFAFFIATGSFFLGQQHLLPRFPGKASLMLTLAVAPLALLVFWLARLRWQRLPARPTG